MQYKCFLCCRTQASQMSGTTTAKKTAAATMKNGHMQEENDLSKLPNRVADMLAGRAILITGGTGFMGKVLIEKILRTCSDVDTIYVLIRAKKGKEPRQRVEELFASPVSDFNERIPYILESNPHPFYSFRGLKNHMRIRIACGLLSRSRAGFWKNYRAAVRALRTIQ